MLKSLWLYETYKYGLQIKQLDVELTQKKKNPRKIWNFSNINASQESKMTKNFKNSIKMKSCWKTVNKTQSISLCMCLSLQKNWWFIFVLVLLLSNSKPWYCTCLFYAHLHCKRLFAVHKDNITGYIVILPT